MLGRFDRKCWNPRCLAFGCGLPGANSRKRVMVLVIVGKRGRGWG